MSIEKFQSMIVSVPTHRISKIDPLRFHKHRSSNALQGGLALKPRPLIKPPEIGGHAAATHQSDSIAVTGVTTMSSVIPSTKILPPLLSFTSPPSQTPAKWSPSPVQENIIMTMPNQRKSSFLSVPNVFPNDFRAQLMTIGPCYPEEPCPSLFKRERSSPGVQNFEIIQERSPTVVKSPANLSDCTSSRKGETSLLLQTGRSLSLGSLTVLHNDSPPGHTGDAGRCLISPGRTSPMPRRNRPALACGKPARHTGRCTFSPYREDSKKALIGGQPSIPNNRDAPTERQIRSIPGDQIQLYNFKLTPSKKATKVRETTSVCCLNRRTVNGTSDTTPTVILNQKPFLNGLSKVSRKKKSCHKQDVNFPSQTLDWQRGHTPSETLCLSCSLPQISQTP